MFVTPSPKLQFQPEIVPEGVLASVKLTQSGAHPVSGVAVKAGVGIGLKATVALPLELPTQLAFEINVTEYVPAAGLIIV